MLEKFLKKTEFESYEDFKANYSLSYPENFNFASSVVDGWAKEAPQKTALIWCDDYSHEKIFTFADISDLSQRAAAFLLSLGIKKGDKVLLVLKRRWEYWITVLALHRIGAIAIPASFQLTAHDLIYRANSAHVKAMIVADDEWIQKQAEETVAACPFISVRLRANGALGEWKNLTEGILNEKNRFAVDPTLKAKDVMIMYFTSGTSGMPKMVVHDHTYPLGHVVTSFWQQVQDGGLHFTGADSGWAKFAWGSLYGQWLRGSAVLGYDQDKKFSATNLIAVIKKYGATSFCVPGTIYRFMLKEGVTAEDFATVKNCATAGEPLAPEVSDEFFKRTGHRIHEGYGQSEGNVLSANFGFFAPVSGSCGKPSPNIEFAIQREDGKICEPGKVGEIVLKNVDKRHPEGLFIGYWIDEKIVPAYDENGTYHTGDYGWTDENGYVWMMGRNDDMIKCSGYRIGPYEIESVLLEHPAVFECAITGEPDPLRGQIIRATIVLNEGYAPSDELTKELQDYVKFHAAPYKYPRKVVYVKALPKTSSGKIIRKEIRDGNLEIL